MSTKTYVYLPKKRHGRSQLAHRQIVERVLGRALPDHAVVHHVDGNSLNNANSNLVVCENDAYHKLLHSRAEAYAATGDPAQRKCAYCRSWSPTAQMSPMGRRWYHKACAAAYQRDRKARK